GIPSPGSLEKPHGGESGGCLYLEEVSEQSPGSPYSAHPGELPYRLGHCTAKRLYKSSRLVQPLRGRTGGDGGRLPRVRRVLRPWASLCNLFEVKTTEVSSIPVLDAALPHSWITVD